MYETVFFDLDGTLTDPGLGITNSVMYALKRYNIEIKDRTELYPFIGPPLIDSFMKYYRFDRKQSEEAVDVYREYFSTKGLYENEIYPGIKELLAELKRRGKRIVLATSKPDGFAKQILEYFEIDKYFDFIGGAAMNETRTKKEEVIEYCLEECGITDVSKVIMIGDREYDVLGAKQFGISCIGVLYGYGNRKELEGAGALHIVEKVGDILELV